MRQSLGETVFKNSISNTNNNNSVEKTLSFKLYKEKKFPYRNSIEQEGRTVLTLQI